MGSTTFSGPIKAGTIAATTGTTLGSDMKNVGQVVMAQSYQFGTEGGAQTATATGLVIPAKSQIIDVVIDVVEVMAGATCVLSIGDTVAGNAAIINGYSVTVAGGTGRRYPTTNAGGSLLWDNTGNNDISVTVTTTGATTNGTIRFTILYQQAVNYPAYAS